MNKLPLLLLGILLGACGVVRGQGFDLTTGRVPVASLDGLWRFQTGDNPAWADPNFDDSKWSLLRSDQGWGSQGYKHYEGMAWYRFQVTVPADLDHVSLYLQELRTSYEVSADGRLIGTFGNMPPKVSSSMGGSGYNVYRLPDGKHLEHTTHFALRVWNIARFHDEGGPSSGGGMVGESSLIEHRDALERGEPALVMRPRRDSGSAGNAGRSWRTRLISSAEKGIRVSMVQPDDVSGRSN